MFSCSERIRSLLSTKDLRLRPEYSIPWRITEAPEVRVRRMMIIECGVGGLSGEGASWIRDDTLTRAGLWKAIDGV